MTSAAFHFIGIAEPGTAFTKEPADPRKQAGPAADGHRMQTDEEIMASIVAGDQRVYAEAVRLHARPIAFYAYRMLGSQSEAEDITQETFLRLWTQASRWQPGKAALSTWLHRIAHNLCIDFLRKSRSSMASELSDDLADGQLSAEEALGIEAERNMLQLALGNLPERQRSALVLTHYQGLSNREVADILAVTVDALESLLARARRSLKAYCQTDSPRHGKNRGHYEQ